MLRETRDVLRSAARQARVRVHRSRTRNRLGAYDRLNLGCGPRHLDGWANIDLEGPGNLIWDLRQPLPLQPGAIRFVYSEHFIEHIAREDAHQLLANCRAAMASGGIIRISTPDLRKLAQDYISGHLVSIPDHGWEPRTLCQMMNEAMRSWNHQFIYDLPELELLLTEAGFSKTRRVGYRESDYEELRGLETRPDMNDLIVEAMAA